MLPYNAHLHNSRYAWGVADDTVAFNYVVYGFTNEEDPLDYIDKTVGEAKSVVSPQVSENG
jgi:hypothetical protein